MSELIEALLVLSRISRHTLHREIVDVSALAESIVQDLRQKDPHAQRRSRDPAEHDRARRPPPDQRPVPEPDRERLEVHVQDRPARASRSASRAAARWRRCSCATTARASTWRTSRSCSSRSSDCTARRSSTARASGSRPSRASSIAMAGRIWAEGKPNAGAVFYFTLPTAPITEHSWSITRAA